MYSNNNDELIFLVTPGIIFYIHFTSTQSLHAWAGIFTVPKPYLWRIQHLNKVLLKINIIHTHNLLNSCIHNNLHKHAEFSTNLDIIGHSNSLHSASFAKGGA